MTTSTQSIGIAAAIDSHWEANEKGHRPHLGASQIGKPCERMLAYSFRHAVEKRNQGRMLRLFNRGHLEEIRLCDWLRRIGFEVREFAQRLVIHTGSDSYGAAEWDETLADGYVDVSHDPAHVAVAAQVGVELRQWSFSDVGGHHAGSTDGKCLCPSDNPYRHLFPTVPLDTWLGLECKTYNQKSFDMMLGTAGGLPEFKPEHYAQMQEYMHYQGLLGTLYFGICKNDDRIFDQLYLYDQASALEHIEKARRVICSTKLPPRKFRASTGFDCKFCDYKDPCWFGAELRKSCRTCVSATAVPDGTGGKWHCGRFNSLIPLDFVKVGCDAWAPVTD